jgi:hypothetical protein
MTWDQVRHELDIPRLQSLNKYWRYHPPAHMMIAQYFGIKKPQPIKNDQAGDSLIAEIQTLGL